MSCTMKLDDGSPRSRPPLLVEAIAHHHRQLCTPSISDNTLPCEDAVCFDVDSTVCTDEGIDELANFCGAGEAVAELTNRAMGGSVSLQEASSARPYIFKPSLARAGEFVGFNPESPTSKTGGKAAAVEIIKKKHGHKVAVMVGDGATDLEARREGAAELFICSGGAQLRPSIAARADWLIFNFDDLWEALSVSS